MIIFAFILYFNVQMDINILPAETLFNILLNLSYRDLQNICGSSIQYRQICDTPTFWRQKILKDFDILYDPNIHGSNERDYYEYLLSDSEIFPGCEIYKGTDTCMKQAITLNNIPLINYFINRNANLPRALKQSLEDGNITLVNYFISKGANPNSILTRYADNRKSLVRADPELFTPVVSYITYTNQPIVFPESVLPWIINNVKYPYNIIVYRKNIYLSPLTYEWHDRVFEKNLHKTFVEMKYMDILDVQFYIPILRNRTKHDVNGILRIQ